MKRREERKRDKKKMREREREREREVNGKVLSEGECRRGVRGER